MAGNREIGVILLRKRLHQERVLSVLIIFSLLLFIWLNHTRDTVYEVRLGNRPLAWLASDQTALSVIRRVRQDLQQTHGPTVRFRGESRESFSIERIQGSQRPPMTESEAVHTIAASLTPEVKAAQITIDGQAVLTLKTREMADTVLTAVRSALVGDREGLVEEPTWKQKVTIGEAFVPPGAIEASAQSAIDRLLRGARVRPATRTATYRVESGDRAWGIARSLGITVDELQRLNPEADFSRLRVGQMLTTAQTTAGRSLLTLVSRRRRSFVEDVPAPMREVLTPTLPRGERRVQAAGRIGKRRVTAEVREENGVAVEERRTVMVSLSEPVSGVVLVGQGPTRPVRTPDSNLRPRNRPRLPPPAPTRS